MPESQAQVIPLIPDPKPGERYSCPLCPLQTPSRKNLGTHIWNEHGQKAFPCPAADCSYRAVRPDNLQTHIRSCTAGARQKRQKVSKPKEIERPGAFRKTRVSVRNLLPPRTDLDLQPPPTGGPSGPPASRASILAPLPTSWSPRPSSQTQAPPAVSRDIQVPQVVPQQVQPPSQQNQIQVSAERPDTVMVDVLAPVSQSTLREKLDDDARGLRAEIKALMERNATLIKENNALKEENGILVQKNDKLKEESGKLEETGKLKEKEIQELGEQKEELEKERQCAKFESDVWRRQYMNMMMESTRR